MDEDAAISLGPLKIWISGLEFPDPNLGQEWLNVTARCEGNGSRVQVSGALFEVSDFKKWKEDLQKFHRTLDGFVELRDRESILSVKISTKKSLAGHLECEIEITGNIIHEKHRYWVQIDQSYHPGLMTQLAAILREYPIHDEK